MMSGYNNRSRDSNHDDRDYERDDDFRNWRRHDDHDHGHGNNKKAAVTLTGTTLNLNRAGDYTIDTSQPNKVVIRYEGDQALKLTTAQFTAITNFNLANPNAELHIQAGLLNGDTVTGTGYLNIKGLSFTEASASGPFETSHNVDAALGSLISTQGIEHVMSHLRVNGSERSAFMAVWDYLDDQYVAGGNYYNIPLNEAFVRLGVEYAEWLDEGHRPLIDITAKFTADGADADTLPERDQSMHDNLLGNISTASIQARDFPDALETELIALVPPGYGDRPWFSGEDQHVGGPAHDGVRAFDYDRGWDRPDWTDRDYNAVIDPAASRDGGDADSIDDQMYYGNGNPNDDWNVIRHEGAGVELGLKIKHRGGDEYAEGTIDPNGVAHYYVMSGSQPGSPNHAEWNFDFSATRLASGQDETFTYKLEIDVDPGPGEAWATLYSSAAPLDTYVTADLFQNSSNYGFYEQFIDTDPNTPGIQPYAFGPGEFNIRITAYDGTDVVLVNEVVVHVI
jgi:hypothetical protein